VTYCSILGPPLISGTAKDRNLKFGVQILRVLFKACKIKGPKGRGLGHVTYFSILGFLNISGISKAAKCPKVVNGDDGNLRAEFPSWSRVELIVLIVGGGWGRGFRGLCPRN